MPRLTLAPPASSPRRAVRVSSPLVVAILLLAACRPVPPASSPVAPSDGGAVPPTDRPAVGATERPTFAPPVVASPRPTPTGEPSLGVDWRRIYGVEQPPGDPLVTPPPAVGTGQSNHPAHYGGGMADLMDAVAGGPGLVAVGFYDRGPQAMAWWSSDAATWRAAAGFPTTDGTIAYTVAAGPSGLVAGGVDASDAAIWTSPDGRTWSRVGDRGAFHDAAGPLEIRAVGWTGERWLAAGFRGGIVHPLTAAFWISKDAETWQRLPDQPDFGDGRIEDLAVGRQGVVAVGYEGEYRQAREGAIWTSAEGLAWQRVTDPSLADGHVRGVTAYDDGFVAVGSRLDDRAARAWLSEDGRTWVAAPDDPALDNLGSKILMQDVTAIGDQLIAGGHLLAGTQYPTAVMWRSADGLTWQRAPDVPAFGQGLVEGIASGGPGVVAVGTYGSPDLFIPTVWISPAWPDG